MKITRDIAQKVLKVVDAGLVKGIGNPVPGKMCVEAAVCYALGLPHGDQPNCVGEAVRQFKIPLNDARWSSDEARTTGLRKLAVAQLGSDTIDQREFARLVAEGTIRQVLPEMLRRVAQREAANHEEALRAAALRCEQEGTAEAALIARDSALAAREASRAAFHCAAALFAAAASASAFAASAFAAAASASAGAYAASAASAAYADYAASAERDHILMISANVGLQALITLKSPGAQFLDLCEGE